MRVVSSVRWSIVAAVLGASATIGGFVHSAPDTSGLGSGADGAYTATTAADIVNKYAAVTAAAGTSVTVASAADFGVNDMILVLQVNGATLTSTSVDPPAAVNLSTAAVGQYDVVKITAKNGDQLTVTPALQGTYRATGAEIVRIPQYTNVTIPDTTGIVAKPWDGTTGGVVAFLATGAVNAVGTGKIDATGAGFRGGNRSKTFCDTLGCAANAVWPEIVDDPDCNESAGKGESFDSRAEAFGDTGCGVGARGTGGGGGGYINAGGAGGGNGGPGQRGGNGWNSEQPIGGYPGAAVTGTLADRLTFGGGGGGGQQNNSAPREDAANEGRGGAGGGIVWFRASQLSIPAGVDANGQPGFFGNSDGAGGGGAGGSVLVRIVDTANCGALRANGGNGGDIGGHGAGAGGGVGRIRIESRGGACAGETIPGTIGVGNSTGIPPAGTPPAPPVEDAGSTAFGCIADAGTCTGTTPTCDTTSRVCRACQAADCTGATPICASDGRCVAPTPDAGPDAGNGGSDGGGGGSDGGGGVVNPKTDAGDGGGGAIPIEGTDGADGGSGSSAGPGESDDAAEDGGCSCKTSSSDSSPVGGIAAVVIGLALLGRRRRRED